MEYTQAEIRAWGQRNDVKEDIVREAMKKFPERKFYEGWQWSCEDGVKPTDVVVEGKVVFCHRQPYAWVQEGKREYRSDVYESPTMTELAMCFAESILVTGDERHIYLEGFTVGHKEGQITVVNIDAGS
jgi:hypothetical protein